MAVGAWVEAVKGVLVGNDGLVVGVQGPTHEMHAQGVGRDGGIHHGGDGGQSSLIPIVTHIVCRKRAPKHIPCTTHAPGYHAPCTHSLKLSSVTINFVLLLIPPLSGGGGPADTQSPNHGQGSPVAGLKK